MNTPKPESQATKRAKDQVDFQTKIMKLVDQEEDELSMTLSALGKKIKRSLTEDVIDELMDKIQILMSWFIRSKKVNIHQPLHPCPDNECCWSCVCELSGYATSSTHGGNIVLCWKSSYYNL